MLKKLETAMTVARAMTAAAQESGASESKLTELMSTLSAIEYEMREMQQMLNEAKGEISNLTLPQKIGCRSESPYYWEDD